MEQRKQNNDPSSPRIHGDEALRSQDRSSGEDLDFRDGSVVANDAAAFDYDDEADREAAIRQEEIDTEDANDQS